MRLLRLTRASLFASVALVPLPLFATNAVERNLFTWSGVVDREVIIEVRGRDVYTSGSGQDASSAPRLRIAQSLPRVPGVIHVRLDNGRGEVTVLDNPSARNNFTARVRVRDPQGGADRYRLVVSFDADNSGGYGDVYDRGDNGRDDRRDNGRDDRRDNGRNNGRNNGHDNGRHNGRTNDDRDDGRGNGRSDDRGNGGSDNGSYDNGNSGRGDDNHDYDYTRRDAGALRWSGVVDGVAEIRIQGRQVALSSEGQPLRNVRYDIVGASLPNRDVSLQLARANGRGTIRVTQQPSRYNNYTAVIRIEDRSSGAAPYDFNLRW
jgi:hypothetical protein